jgi:undecaprenyl pyrophosphate synthase
MTDNEVLKLSWDKFQRHPDRAEVELALAACKEERARIVRAVQRSANSVRAGVSKPDLWALAKLIEDML